MSFSLAYLEAAQQATNNVHNSLSVGGKLEYMIMDGAKIPL